VRKWPHGGETEEAKVTEKLWSLEDMVALVDE
jgi:hypothetical protein